MIAIKVELIRSRGFIAQVYHVVTPDGYILTLHRIINPFVPQNRVKKTLLLVHGILATGTDWLLSRSGRLRADGSYVEDGYALPVEFRQLNGEMVPIGGSTAFVLSQFGYDVWLGNTRGTTYSRNHIRYDHKTGKINKFKNDLIKSYLISRSEVLDVHLGSVSFI